MMPSESSAKPISDSLKFKYLDFIKPIKYQLDNILFEPEIIENEQPEQTIIIQANS